MGVATENNDGGAGWRTTRKRSLVISPNLDKLLEHEERSRRSNDAIFPGCTPVEASTMGSTLPDGLPPPPRRNRRSPTPRSRRSLVKTSDTGCPPDGQETLPVRSSNPYINPAPTAEELFPLWHDSARPVPSQQSTRTDDQQNLSFRVPATRCFRAVKGGNFAVSHILAFSASSPDYGGRTCIPRILDGDLNFSSNCLDPTSHRMSVKPGHPDHNQSSSHPSTMTSPGSPTFECPSRNVEPALPANPNPAVSRHPSLLKKRSALNSLPTNVTKPATTNLLDEMERADLVRKSRKLARLFGETPNAEAVVNQAGLVPTAGKDSKPDIAQVIPPHRDRHSPDGATAFSRRYSLPLRVDGTPSTDFSTAVDADGRFGSRSKRPSVDRPIEPNSPHQARSYSPVSFIELSDDKSTTSRISVSSSYSKTASPLENERRRKRERLAKLYRFLGPQVPINLVLGIDDTSAASLPQRQQHDANDTENRPAIQRRRKSSSAIPILSAWSDDVERLKADLDDREKAIIVRRAQKMEKLFGVAPPLPLYYPHSASAPSSGSATPFATTALKSSKQKESRPATPESSRQLLPRRTDSLGSSVRFDHRSAQASSSGHSSFYNHYEHSLNSLNDIIDRDDKASLAELYQALHGEIVPLERSATPTSLGGHRSSISSVLPRSECHGAFPARASMISLDSEFSFTLTPPMPQASSFQQRRKRAAKLTHFFGVDYRELFDDVLETLENDMQLGKSEGVLRAEEAEDLLQKLRKLRYKRLAFL